MMTTQPTPAMMITSMTVGLGMIAVWIAEKQLDFEETPPDDSTMIINPGNRPGTRPWHRPDQHHRMPRLLPRVVPDRLRSAVEPQARRAPSTTDRFQRIEAELPGTRTTINQTNNPGQNLVERVEVNRAAQVKATSAAQVARRSPKAATMTSIAVWPVPPFDLMYLDLEPAFRVRHRCLRESMYSGTSLPSVIEDPNVLENKMIELRGIPTLCNPSVNSRRSIN